MTKSLLAKSFRSIYLVGLLTFAHPAFSDSIGFLYALDADLDALKAGESAGVRSVQVGGTNIQEFRVGVHTVRATKMGAGNIETAINTANLLARFSADLVISVGPCGSLCDELPVGRWFRIEHVTGYQRGTSSTTGWIQSPSAKLSVDPLPKREGSPNSTFADLPGISLASGDAFVANHAEREAIRVSTGADAVDMNSFGLMMVCRQTRVPTLIWKIVSDQANAKAGEDFKEFIKNYDGEGGRQVRELLLNMTASPLAPESYENIRELMP